MVKPDLQVDAQRVFLDAVFSHEPLASVFVLKGAHAAALVGGTRRPTKDVDLTSRLPCRPEDEMRRWLTSEVVRALRSYSDAVDNDWTVHTVSAARRPRLPHRFGWDSYDVKATLQFRSKGHHVVEADISFGDFADATVTIAFGERGTPVVCYSREQIIAEKLRAFLQKLPAYRLKIGNDPIGDLRLRDIGDIHQLASGVQLDVEAIGSMLRAKCIAKSVDLESFGDFLPREFTLDEYRLRYDEEPNRYAAPFDDAWETVRSVVDAIQRSTGLPGRTPMPFRATPSR